MIRKRTIQHINEYGYEGFSNFNLLNNSGVLNGF